MSEIDQMKEVEEELVPMDEEVLQIAEGDTETEQSQMPMTPPRTEEERVEFLLPVSPAKRFSTMVEGPSREPPHSPDTRFARHRLGALLSSIKQGDTAPSSQDIGQQVFDEDILLSPNSKRGPGRPKKKLGKEKQVVFELRGKPFGLEDGRTATEYQLCRAWMRGKSEDLPITKPLEMPPLEIPVELLAARDIYTMPPPSGECQGEETLSQSGLDQFNAEVDAQDMHRLREEYSRHWRNVKKHWRGQMRERSQRYAESIQLLELVFHNAQQAQSQGA